MTKIVKKTWNNKWGRISFAVLLITGLIVGSMFALVSFFDYQLILENKTFTIEPENKANLVHAATLTTLRPTADGTENGSVEHQSGSCNTSGICYQYMDDDPDSPDTGDYVFDDGSSGNMFFLLTDMPSDFVSMDTLQIDIYTDSYQPGNDSVDLYAQVYQSNESSALTDEEFIAAETDADGLKSITFSGVQASNKSTWDGARLRLRWDYNKSQSADDNTVRSVAVELDGTYTPTGPALPDLYQIHYRFKDDSTSESTNTWLANEDTSISIFEGVIRRLRISVKNTGGEATSSAYRLEYSTSTSGPWTQLQTSGTDWVMTASTQLTDGASSTDNAGLSNDSLTFTSGQVKESGSQTGNIAIGASQITELEYSIMATSSAADSSVYYFRVTRSGSTSSLTYTQYASATAAGIDTITDVTQIHYRWYENSDQITPSSSLAIGLEDTPATSTSSIFRLRINARATSTGVSAGEAFKLQFSTATSGPWTDVDGIGGSAIWRGYNNAGVSDGATIPHTVLSHSGIVETYEEENNSASVPNPFSITSNDLGKNWTEATSGAAWDQREMQSAFAYDNKMWVINGVGSGGGGGYKDDVWYSTNGISWIEATDAPPFGDRKNHVSLVYDNKMWLIGGEDGSTIYNDVWYSTNGSSWATTTDSASWGAVEDHSGLVYDNKMWIFGGTESGGVTSEVWYSTNGTAWAQATSSANWSSREDHVSVVHDNKMWVMGGDDGSFKSDVWYSTDGVSWTEATSAAQWSGRDDFTAVAYDEKMWIIGGSNPGLLNDVWYSTDGVSWTEATSSAPWEARDDLSSFVFENKIWILGGSVADDCNGTGDIWCKDVWYSEGNGVGEWDWVLEKNGALNDTPYYFKMIGSNGNEFYNYEVYPKITLIGAVATSTPTASINSFSQKTDGSGKVEISVDFDDADNDEVRGKYEYDASASGGCATWLDPSMDESAGATADYNDTGGSPLVENDNSYQVGSSTTRGIITSSGANTVSSTWLSNTDQSSGNTSMCIRVTPNDGADGTAVTATTTIDNVNPTSPGNLSTSSLSTSSVTIVFGASSTETNFNRYRIFYKTGSSGVAESDTEHTDSDLTDQNFNGTTSTILTGLATSTQYVINIWAYDDYCTTSYASCSKNKSIATEITFTTQGTNANIRQIHWRWRNDDGAQ